MDPPSLLHTGKCQISFRNLKSVAPEDISTSISVTLASTALPLPSANLDDLLLYYTQTTPQLHKMKSHKHQLERLHNRTDLSVHRQAYTDQLHQYRSALNSARTAY
ncbi:uncharacterized protein V6R79_013763 [Siganus canaliculatus]